MQICDYCTPLPLCCKQMSVVPKINLLKCIIINIFFCLFPLDEPTDYPDTYDETTNLDGSATSDKAITEGVRLLDDTMDGYDKPKEKPPTFHLTRGGVVTTGKNTPTMSTCSSTNMEGLQIPHRSTQQCRKRN
jgi:hypothetical protein